MVVNQQLEGLIALADLIRDESKEAVKKLKERNQSSHADR